MEKDDKIPLFFYAKDPIGVFIIDNELIKFELIGDLRNSGQYAFYLLSKLSGNELIANKLPEKLVQKQLEYFANIKVPWPCITGILFETNHCKCLSVKVTIKKTDKKPLIHFSDFALMNGHAVKFMIDEIPGEVFLEPSDAYILLANQVATCYSDLLFQTYNEKHKEYYRKYLRENILNHFKRKTAPNFGPLTFNPKYTAFSLDYFEYLEKQLLNGKIIPFDILKLSGPMIINKLSVFMLETKIINEFIEKTALELIDNYDFLSTNHRIMYYTLHRSAEYYKFPTKSTIFQQNKKAITKKIKRDHLKPFPRYPEGEEDNIFNVWKRYNLPEPNYPYLNKK
ncbi:MAG: hypothetical protein FK730_14620 [Asgard group archaeon]|nr:hypothetical protein [Asgard group archaeon]